MKLLISPSPHLHNNDSIEKNMYGVLIALIPAFICSVLFFGMGAVIVTLTSVVACLIFEYLIQKFLLKCQPSVFDGSAIITGVLLAFNVPSNLPVWIVIIGALVAIGIGKMSFGGLGCNIFNPALVGRVFLLISFPVQMTTWPETAGFSQFLRRCRNRSYTFGYPKRSFKKRTIGDGSHVVREYCRLPGNVFRQYGR